MKNLPIGISTFSEIISENCYYVDFYQKIPGLRIKTLDCRDGNMKLPNYEKAFIPKSKITEYLLSLSHRDGCTKARFFLRFDFSSDQWELFARALRRHAARNEIVRTEKSFFGMRYVIDGILESPDGRNPEIRSIWFIKEEMNEPSFVTAYPLKGK